MINYKYIINIYIEVPDRMSTEVNSGAVTSAEQGRGTGRDTTQTDGWRA